MNRRQLFGWLTALPFVPAALSKPCEVSGELYARTVTFPPATANWGDVRYFITPDGIWVFGERTTELWTNDHAWRLGDQWSPAEQAILEARVSRPLQFARYEGFTSREIPRCVDPAINMKYRPNLPEWF